MTGMQKNKEFHELTQIAVGLPAGYINKIEKNIQFSSIIYSFIING